MSESSRTSPRPDEKTKSFQKYLFKGTAVAFQGSIRKPYFQELGAHAVASTYAGSAGISTARNEGFSLGRDVSYKAAYSSVRSEKAGSAFRTTIESTIEDLRMAGGRISVGAVVGRLQTSYDPSQYPDRKASRILPIGSYIKELRIDGKPISVDLPSAFNATELESRDFFSGKYDNDPKYNPGFIPKSIYVEDLGTLHLGEWVWVHPDERHQQHLTMIRLSLGSDFGATFECASLEGNGKGWPP